MNYKNGLNLIGEFPTVGIRPIIDGRQNGVRESLEDQTMEMAKSAAELITRSLRYPDGSPVTCVIAEKTIGGVAEAAMAEEEFKRKNVGLTISVTPCWCYGSETMDMHPLRPKAVWGFNGTERPGAVYLAAVLAAHGQKGIPAFGIYGKNIQDAGDTSIPEDVAEKILRFTRAGLATAIMAGKSYLGIGNVSMGIMGSYTNHDFFENYLGMRCETVDMSEIIRRIELEIYDEDEYQKALTWVKANCSVGQDYNPKDIQRSPEQKEKDWEFSVKMALIGRDLMVGNDKLAEKGFGEESLGHNAIAAGFQGQRQWTDYFPNGDFMEAILNSSFDWNGTRHPYIMATENDTLNAISMLLNYLLTNRAQIFADVRTYWSPESVKRVTNYILEGHAQHGIIHLINSGAAALDGTGQQKDENGHATIKPFWAISDDEVQRCLEHTLWSPANLGYFRGGGYSSSFLTAGGMPLTMTRVNLIKGKGPVIQIAEGYSVTLPEKVHQVLDKRTDPAWPTTWFAPRLTSKSPFDSVYSVMNNWGANHGAISFGHIGADLISLASILRIPVFMHNVSEEQIFRPAVWNSFGTDHKEAADFAACQNFGPIYR